MLFLGMRKKGTGTFCVNGGDVAPVLGAVTLSAAAGRNTS